MQNFYVVGSGTSGFCVSRLRPLLSPDIGSCPAVLPLVFVSCLVFLLFLACICFLLALHSSLPTFPFILLQPGVWLLPNIALLPQICSACVRCKSCGATPGKNWDVEWSGDYSLCPRCTQLYEKGGDLAGECHPGGPQGRGPGI